jgi:hypothetical protein
MLSCWVKPDSQVPKSDSLLRAMIPTSGSDGVSVMAGVPVFTRRSA